MSVTLIKRPRVSLIKPYLVGLEREAALDSLEAAGLISQRYNTYRWNTAARCSEWIETREIAHALRPSGLGCEATAIERADYYTLRAAFPSLLSAEYWLEISPSTQVTRDLIAALEGLGESGLDQSEVELQRDEILRSAWDNYGWRELRDTASDALGEILDSAAMELGEIEHDSASETLEAALDNLGDYDAIADAGIDAIEIESGNAEFEGLQDLAQTLAAQAAAVAGVEL